MIILVIFIKKITIGFLYLFQLNTNLNMFDIVITTKPRIKVAFRISVR